MTTKIQLRRDTSANWTSINPTLFSGEIGFETNTGKFKIGNGSSVWSDLSYFGGEVDLSTYLTISSASTTYLTQASASATYLAQSSASTTYLTQASASATYLAQSSATSPAYLPFVSGSYYKNPGANNSGISCNLNSTNFGHFYVGQTTSFDRIGCSTGTVTTAGAARLGIYTDSGGKPGTLVLDAGTVAYSTNNTAYLITINQSLTPGWYWLAHNMQSGSSLFFGSGGNQSSIQGVQRMFSTNTFTNMISGYEESSVTGAFPASASAAFSQTNGIVSAYLRAT
jgi:hypothetical protein